jgi:hypothetical protein
MHIINFNDNYLYVKCIGFVCTKERVKNHSIVGN